MNRNLIQLRRIITSSHNRCYSSKAEPDKNKPISFLSSPASKKSALQPVLRKNLEADAPWYQMYSVVGSIAVFMLYFCVLREENDIDNEFSKSLYQRIQGLEKAQLLVLYKQYKDQGMSTIDIEQRLKELEAEEGVVLF